MITYYFYWKLIGIIKTTNLKSEKISLNKNQFEQCKKKCASYIDVNVDEMLADCVYIKIEK